MSNEEALTLEVTKEGLIVDALRVDELKGELKKRKIRTTGNKAELVSRLKAALVLDGEREDEDPRSQAESEDSDEMESAIHSEDESQAKQNRNNKVTRTGSGTQQLLTFKDVEETMQPFRGDKGINIRQWLEEFEEMACLCQWSEVQKMIYVKRLLQGPAKLFLRHEGTAKTWNKIKKALKDEFSCTVDSHKVHKELSRTTKLPNESYEEYIYKMYDIAAQADVELPSIIKYIVDGIEDDEVNKTILYGATSMRELKTKFALYEGLKANMKKKTKHVGWKPTTKKITPDTRKAEMRCFNCGDPNHQHHACPAKHQGRKCFKCNAFGHIATSCPNKKDEVKHVTMNKDCNNVQKSRGGYKKKVGISGYKLEALIDSGSQLTLMRASQYLKMKLPALRERIINFSGVGSESNSTLGGFVTKIAIDGEVYPIKIHVVPDTAMRHDLLIGSDLLDNVCTVMEGGEISISPLKGNSNTDSEIPEVLQIDVIENSREPDLSHIVNPVQKEKVQDLVKCYTPNKVLGVGIKMTIVLTDDIPVSQRPRRLSPEDKRDVDAQIQTWLEEGIVKPSLSDYASPVVLVRKKDGTKRICIDYRQLNRKIAKIRYPLPLIEDQIDSLQGARFFSTLDLKNGFFHVEIEEQSQKYTSFVVPNGQFEFLKVPFGLCNSPSIFQKFINAVFKNEIASGKVLTYMDDLIIPSVNRENGIHNLEAVLDTASKHGLQINWKKCSFLQSKIEYLGYQIEDGNVRPSEYKTSAVMKFPKPNSVKDLQSFLGLTGYFRKFVPRYSIIARPLTNMLRGERKFNFGAAEEKAFLQLKGILANEPVLRLYRTGAETELHTDASSFGFGAVLMQRDSNDGAFHPIYYASSKTTLAEEKYTSYELEVLAVIKALKKFRVYLIGLAFKIVTDCQAFAMTMNKKELCVRVARWAMLLEEFQYTIEHRPGKRMPHVDALSRKPLFNVMIVEECERGLIERIKKVQRSDDCLREIISNIENHHRSGYVIKNGLLCREVGDDPLIVLPKTMQAQVVRRCHERGHFGINKTEALVKTDYWFEDMRARVEEIVRNCVDCILAERKHGKQECFLKTIDKGDAPLITYHIDHLGPLSSTKKRYHYIFAVVDAFTKFIWLYPTRSTDTAEVIDRLSKQAVTFGNPQRIISDRGTAFTSHAFEEYCSKEGIQHVKITTGVPRSNGQVERMNRILIPLLTKLTSPKPEDWYKHVEKAQKFINATPSRATGMSPFKLLIGTDMRLQEDLQIRKMIEEERIALFQEDRDEMREKAKGAICKIQEENRRNYNKKRKSPTRYMEGDTVAIKRTQAVPGLKLRPKFLGPYRVTKVLRNDRYLVEKNGEHEGPKITSTVADFMKPWIEN